MAFILTAKTAGDELIPSTTKVIATSDDREVLDKMKTARAKERQEWLSTNYVENETWHQIRRIAPKQ